MNINKSLTVASDASSVERPEWVIPVAALTGFALIMVLSIVIVLIVKKYRKNK